MPIVICRFIVDLGPGSSLDFAQEMTAALHVIIGELKRYLGTERIRLLDVPCGDLQWMSRFLQTRSDIDYTGIDIVSNVIEHHRSMFADRGWKFLNLDIVSQSINVTDYDLIMTRQMTQHLVHTDVIRILHKFSNVTMLHRRPAFLLATTYPNTAYNAKLDLHSSIRYALQNLEIKPFRLEPPRCLFRDGPASSAHYMGLWQLPLKVIALSSCSMPAAFSTPLTESPVYSCVNWSLPASKKLWATCKCFSVLCRTCKSPSLLIQWCVFYALHPCVALPIMLHRLTSLLYQFVCS